LSLRRHETTSAQGRARERYRLAAWAALTNVASRGLSMLLVILGVRLTTNYLGTTRFGVWATVASMTAMLSLLDLGVGNALINRVAHAVASDDPAAMRRIVTGGAGVLAMIGLAVMAILLPLALLLPWQELLKLPDSALSVEARNAAIVFAVLFSVNLFGSGLLRILAGQQRSHEVNLLSGCATGLACLGLFWASSQHASVPWLLVATFGFQTLAGLAAGALLVRRGLISRHGAGAAVTSERPHLLRVGSLFLLLQLGTMLGWGGDSVILAVARGASDVAVFAVAMRLFQFASQPLAMLNAPLWAAYADATARHDFHFVRHTLKRSLLISLVGTSTLSCALVIAAPFLVSTWTHGTVSIPTPLLALLALWTVIDGCGNAFGVYLNGTGVVREQVWVVTAFCALAFPLKLLVAPELGAPGLVVATIASYGIAVIGPYLTILRTRVLKPTTEQAT
jgi:O-antigen/teichoic acid export membrane protein